MKKICIPCLLPSLGLLFAHIFMWSRNVHMFSNEALLGALVIILVWAAVLFCGNFYVLPWILCQTPAKKSRRIFLFCIMSLQFVFFTLYAVQYGFFSHKSIVYLSILTITFFVILYLMYIDKSQIIIIYLCIMMAFSGIIFIKNVHTKRNYPFFSFSEEMYNLKFKHHPNIYVFWLESYHDFEILKKTYGIDSEKYRKNLEDAKFNIQEHTYSSSTHTLWAFTQLYTQQTLDYLKYMLTDLTVLRDIIGGNDTNFVFRILKKNNYKTFHITEGIKNMPYHEGGLFYIQRQGKYLDEIDIKLSYAYKYIYPIISISYIYIRFPVLKELLAYLMKNDEYQGDVYDRVKMILDKRKSDAPYCVVFKGGAAHPYGKHNWKNREEWITGSEYRTLIQESNVQSQALIDYIVKNDPGSLILLMGDHGAYGPALSMLSVDEYQSDIHDIFDAAFRVLFAYRLPHGAQDDISRGMYMNNVNIFMHIFAYLAENPDILKHRATSASRLGGIKMEEGKLVSPPKSPTIPPPSM